MFAAYLKGIVGVQQLKWGWINDHEHLLDAFSSGKQKKPINLQKLNEHKKICESRKSRFQFLARKKIKLK